MPDKILPRKKIKKAVSKKTKNIGVLDYLKEVKNKVDFKLEEILLFLALFFTPIFFLPNTVAPLFLNKQILIFSLLTLSFFVWLYKFIKTGKAKIGSSTPLFIIFFGLLTAVLSWFLSGRTYFGFFGFLGGESSSILNIFIFVFAFFLIQMVFLEKKKIEEALLLFGASSFLSILIWFLAKVGLLSFWAGFNTIGSIDSFVLFLISGFFIFVGFLLHQKYNFQKVIIYALLAVFLAVFLHLGFNWAWYFIVLGLVLFIILYFSGKKQFETKKLYLILLLVILSFSILFSFSNLTKTFSEQRLSYSASEKIMVSHYKNSTKDLLFGSGPSSFGYSFLKYKEGVMPNIEVNRLKLNSGYSALTDYLTEVGFLGGGVIFIFFLSTLGLGVRFLFFQFRKDEYNPVAIALFIVVLISFLEIIFAPANYIVLFFSFVFASLFINYKNSIEGKDLKVIDLSYQKKYIFLTLALVILIISLFVFLSYKIILRYDAQVSYYKAYSIVSADNQDEFLSLLGRSISLDSKNDAYHRLLADFNFAFLQNKIKNIKNLNDDSLAEIREDIKVVENLYKNAINLNSKEPVNFVRLGLMYESLTSLSGSFAEPAKQAYEKALSLDPKNVDVLFFLGKMYYELDETDSAKKIFSDILTLFPKDENTRFYLGLSYVKDEEIESALEEFLYLKRIAPKNSLVDEFIETLNKKL